MTKDKLTGRVSYRLGGQVFKQAERQAAAQNLSVNEWRRQAVIEKLKGQTPASRAETGRISRGELVLLEEILRIRFLIYYGVQAHIGSSFGLTSEVWKSLTDQANGGPRFKEIAKRWLEFYGLISPAD